MNFYNLVAMMLVALACLMLASNLVDAAAASAAATSSVTSVAHVGRGNIVDGISDALASSSKKFATAGTNGLLIGTDGFAKMYKDTLGRPATTAGVAVQNVATSLSNSNKIFGDGFRASIDDTMARPMASIASTAQNLFASGGASQGAWFDNAITKPFSLFGSAARDLLSSSFPGEAEATTTTTSTATRGASASASASGPAMGQPLFSASGESLFNFPGGSFGLSGLGRA